MQPNTTSVITNKATEQFQTIQMGFDQSAIVHLMDVLTNLYSDSALAVIREYSTNARDSHLAAGNDDPIEVFLPGPFNGNFRVVDKGVGLSTDDVYNIYSKYGRSTKRGNNVETGMLGLGCKSGLAYTKKFTLKAIKDGVKTIAVISRGDDGAGTITILDTLSTDEPNGVTIEVPVKDQSEFNKRARDFFRFWKPGTVLVDGAEPKLPEGIWLTKNLLLVKSQDHNTTDTVVMGGVAYPVRQFRPGRDLPYRHHLIAWVDMGAVEFVPSREDLLYTDLTNQTLLGIGRDARAQIQRLSQAEITAAKTAPEAARAYLRWNHLVRSGLTWKGNPISGAVDVGNDYGCTNKTFLYRPNGYNRKVTDPRRMDLDEILVTPQVVNFTNQAVSGTARAKVDYYLGEQGVSANNVLFVAERVGAPWSDEALVIDYADILAVKLPKMNAAGVPVSKDVFPSWEGSDFKNRSDFPTDKEIILTTTAYELSPRSASDHYPDAIVVVAGKNRWDKFKRENPSAISLDDKIQAEVDSITAQWTLSDLIENGRVSGAGFARSLNILRNESIDDPDLKAAIKSVSTPVNTALDRRFTNAMVLARQMKTERWGPGLKVEVNHTFNLEGIIELEGKYPLLRYLERSNAAEMAEYVNLMYTKENK